MTRLTFGVLLWSVVYFIPAIVGDLIKNLVNRIGEYPFKGVLALPMAIAIYLIISGWKSVVPDIVYNPTDWGGCAAISLVRPRGCIWEILPAN